VLGLVLVLAAAGVAAYLVMGPKTQPVVTDSTDTSLNSASDDDTTTKDEKDTTDADTTDMTMITFTDSGFTPREYTVKVGQPVMVMNNSSGQLQFSSDDHPTHTEQSELNLPVLEPGTDTTFTPTQVGTWGFHDHLHDQYTGVLKVVE
jgi:hypothetical protein